MKGPVSREARYVTNLGLLAAALFALVVFALLASPAPADVIRPVVQLGPTTVANGTAVVSGTLGVPTAELTINGRPVAIAADGSFTVTVALGGAGNLSIAVRNPVTRETMTTHIPLTTNVVGPGGVVGPGVLAALEQAGVTILRPAGGFWIRDGLPLRIAGSVLQKDDLASLRVNGTDVLGRVTDGRFVVEVPGTTREVSVTATDRQGVSQSTVLPVDHAAAAGGGTPPAGGAVVARSTAAANAVGVRIASVRYRLKAVRRTKRLRVVVTVTDGRGLRVRGAAVGVRSVRVRWIARNPRAKRTNRVGQTAFVLTVRNRAFGKRLRLIVVAKTPKAKVKKTSAVRLPRLAKRAGARRT